MSSTGWSPLASRSAHPRTAKARAIAPYGVALHTTGSGLPRAAIAAGRDPLEYAEELYGSMEYYAHYVIGYDGQAVQVCDERQVAPHIGRIVQGQDRRAAYLSRGWLGMVPSTVVALWRAAWPGRSDPYSLFPGASPNGAYVGIEMIPIYPTPAKGLRFWPAQHASAAALAADIGRRHGWPHEWALTSRLVGHEDVGLIDRHDAGGGWDPGALRAEPWVDMLSIRLRAVELEGLTVVA